MQSASCSTQCNLNITVISLLINTKTTDIYLYLLIDTMNKTQSRIGLKIQKAKSETCFTKMNVYTSFISCSELTLHQQHVLNIATSIPTCPKQSSLNLLRNQNLGIYPYHPMTFLIKNPYHPR